MQEVEDIERYLTNLHRSMQEYFSTLPRDIGDGISVVDLDDLANTTLADPGADRIVFWDDGAGVYTWLVANTGLAISTTNLNLSHLGLESLTDPGADRIFFWDDGETASKWLAPDGTTIEISGTTLQVITGGLDHGGLTGLADDDHPQYILHSLCTVTADFLMGSGVNTFVKKTLSEAGAALETDIEHGNIQALGTGADHSYIDQDVTISASPTFADLTLQDTITIGDGTDIHLIKAVQEPGLGGRLTIGLDETARTIAICDAGDIDADFELGARGSPSLYMMSSNYAQYTRWDYIGLHIFSASGFNLVTRSDISSGDAISLKSVGAASELTDTNAEQAFIKIEPFVNQTDTANYVGLLMDVTETAAVGSADMLIDLRVSTASQFSVDPSGNTIVAGSITVPNEGLHLLDLGSDHDLIIKPGTDLSADRILTITPGDAARTITLSGNPTLSDWFDQSVKQAASPTFTGVDLGTAMPATDTRVRVYASANQDDIADGAWTTLAFDSESYDTGADYNTGTYTYVTPVAGYYCGTLQVLFGDLTSDKRYGVGIYNSTDARHEALSFYSIGTAPAAIVLTTAFTAYIDAGKSIVFQAYQNVGAATVDLSSGEYSSFGSIHLLSV